MDKDNVYKLFDEILENNTLAEVADKLNLHIGTVKRWKEKKSVPLNYYNDLNSILGNKYAHYDDYRNNDQFYTKDKTALYCFNKTIEVLKSLKIDIDDYIFIEPSAGCCNFYNLLPKDRKIGIDIDPKGEFKNELIKIDYLNFNPEKNKKYIVIGNPPFGLRGNLALRFINHSSKFADFVCFILPPLFDSTGKGVPMKRIRDYKLIHSEKLPIDSFCFPDGNDVNIMTIFQIWSKIGDVDLSKREKKDVTKYIKIYSLSNGKSSGSKRNVEMIGKCDIYLPSTCFGGMKPYDTFEELPNKRGYGIVIFKNKEIVIKKIKSLDWEKIAFLSTNSALNLRIDLIIDALLENNIIGED